MKLTSAPDIETEPELALFLDRLLAEATAHPEKLQDASEVFARDADLMPDASFATPERLRVRQTSELLARSARLTAGIKLEGEAQP